MDAQELALVRETIQHALTSHEAAKLNEALDSLGFFELVADDAISAWSSLFEVQGTECVSSPALDLVVLDALGIETGAVVYPTFTSGIRPAATLHGNRLTIDGLLLNGTAQAGMLVVAALDDQGAVSIATIDANATGLQRQAVHGFDPELGLVAITGEVEAGALTPDEGRWELATSRAQRAIAQELTGVSAALLAIAIEHVKTREQFGAPIAVFQAVKHRLADAHIAITAARAALDVAWASDDPFINTLAKLVAGQAITTTARNCPQVTGAMGFTWEMGLHKYVRRGFVLDSFLGSSTMLRSEIGAGFVEGDGVPPLGELVG